MILIVGVVLTLLLKFLYSRLGEKIKEGKKREVELLKNKLGVLKFKFIILCLPMLKCLGDLRIIEDDCCFFKL